MTRNLIFCAAIILAALFIGGCTELERSGYSPIPQNAPASWNYQPYGDLRN